jgi:hypothetical protein
MDFFDRSGLKAGDELSPKLERAARRSAIMISLVSPSYLRAPWCIHETEWFRASRQLAQDPIERRLIPILFNPVDESDFVAVSTVDYRPTAWFPLHARQRARPWERRMGFHRWPRPPPQAGS